MRFFLLLGVLAAQVPATQELARQVIANEVRQYEEFGEFTFRYDATYRRYNQAGKRVSESSEAGETYMSHKRNVDIALTRDGKPLRPKDLGRVQKAATAKLEADARERQASTYVEKPIDQKPGAGLSRNLVRMSAVDVLRYCQLSPPRTEKQLLALDFQQCKSPWPDEAH